MDVILTPKSTYSGNLKAAKAFKHKALIYLSNLVTEAKFNGLDQLARTYEIMPGFEIVVGKNFNQLFTHVHITNEAAQAVAAGTDTREPFNIVTIETIPVTLDESFGGGTTYDSYKVSWTGGAKPFIPQLGGLVEGVKTTNCIVVMEHTDDFYCIVKKEIETDPWGAVNAEGSTENTLVGLKVTGSNLRDLFAPFSGSDGQLGKFWRGVFYSFGKFSAFGPPAVDEFLMAAVSKVATAITWSGGLSPFTAVLTGVVYAAGSYAISFLEGNHSKRNVILSKTSAFAYWAFLDVNGSTNGLNVKIMSDDEEILTIPFNELTGVKPQYQVLSQISSGNPGGVPTAKCHYGIGNYSVSLDGTFNTGFTVSGNYDEYTITLHPINPTAFWGYFGGGSVMVADSLSSTNFFFSSTFGPALYHPMTFSRQALSPTKTSNSGSVATTASITITSGGVGPYFAELINFPGGSGVTVVDNFVNIGEYSDSNRPKFTLSYDGVGLNFNIGAIFQLKITDGAGQVLYVNIQSATTTTFTTPNYNAMTSNYTAPDVYGSGAYSGWHAAGYTGQVTFGTSSNPPSGQTPIQSKTISGKTILYHVVPISITEYNHWNNADGGAPNNAWTRVITYTNSLQGSSISEVNTACGLSLTTSDFWVPGWLSGWPDAYGNGKYMSSATVRIYSVT